MRARWIGVMLLGLGLSACGGPNPLPDSQKGMVKLGKPYEVGGHHYYPSYDPQYDKTGEASWYGPGFDGGHTANGETFNTNDLTAAHATLPMPSLVRVTNLENGKSIVVRINDRGPFAADRIIDLSSKAAEELDVKSQGTAQVRVQYLKKETEDYVAQMKQDKEFAAMANNPPVNVAPDNYNDFRTGNDVAQTNPLMVENRAIGASAPVALVASNDLAPIPQLGALSPAATQPEKAITTTTTTTYLQPPATPEISAAVNSERSELEEQSIKNPSSLPQIGGGVPIPAAMPPTIGGASTVSQLPPPTPVNTMVASMGDTLPDASSASPSIGGEQWYIQAGAFSMRENAAKLQQRLDALGPTALSEIAANGKTWYRVRLGPVTDQQSAQAKLNQILQMGLSDARIVRN